MSKKFYLVLVIIGIVSVIAAFLYPFQSSSHKEPVKLYEQMSQKFSDTEKLAVDYGIKTDQFYAQEFNISSVKYGSSMKTILTSYQGSATAVYRKNNLPVVCSEFYQGIDCYLLDDNSNFPPIAEIIRVNLSGKVLANTSVSVDKVNGRPCYKFSGVKISDPSSLGALGYAYGDAIYPAGEQPGRNVYGMVDVCMDKEFGFPSSVRVSFRRFSRLTNSEETLQSYEVILKGVRQDVRKEEMEIPVPFGIASVKCEGKFVNVSISPLIDKDSAEFEINISKYDVISNGFKTQLVDKKEISGLEYGKNRDIIIPVNLAGTSYDVKVCSNEHCSAKSCYVVNPVQDSYLTEGGGCVGTDSKPICVSLAPQGYVKITNGYPKSFNTSEFAVFVNLDTEPMQRGCVWSSPILEVGSSVTCDFAGNRCAPGNIVSVGITNSSKPPIVINC